MNSITKQKKIAESEKADPTILDDLICQKKQAQAKLNELIKLHSGTPRRVRIESVTDYKKCKKENDAVVYPEGISWDTLKLDRRIAEFMSASSRMMGLKDKDITFDKIIIAWKSVDMLRQIIVDGFFMPILHADGTVENRKYRFFTSSAGQLRRDKIQVISEDMWNRTQKTLMCGLTFDSINEKNGINTSKLMAYLSLSTSATEEWKDFDIDRTIVIPDYEADVTGIMKYIYPNYTTDVKEHTVTIDHVDGSGVMLPCVNNGSYTNFMVRMPWCKGLLSTFDYLKFCEVNHCPAVIKDIYGKEHDLIKENIQIMFTKSQFKLWKYYKDWDDYKQKFKENHCSANRTNFEEDWLPDKQFNYQFLQSCQDMTDEEIDTFTSKEHERIQNIASNKDSMLRALGVTIDTDDYYLKSLMLYNSLLRDGYAKYNLKAIKKKMLLDAKSGAIKCKNKRLFALPDFYAACQHWFLHQEHPDGLLQGDEIAAKLFRKHCVPVNRQDYIDANFDPGRCTNDIIYVADVLRSPHLSMEHMICPIVDDNEVYDWFRTNGVYTSVHSLITRRLQLDCDGDQLNLCTDKIIVNVALRNCKEYDVHTLFYDAVKAHDELVTMENLFRGVKRSHDYSGIGQVSNNLTKIWNKENPDREAADLLCKYNNMVIDGAKTGSVDSYENYPDICKKINKATGGKRGKMPHFFQYSKNGRRTENNGATYAKPNNSTMNRICARFDDLNRVKLSDANIPPFNWQMLMPGDDDVYNPDIVQKFCDLDDFSTIAYINNAHDEEQKPSNYLIESILTDECRDKLIEYLGSLDAAYPSITKYLFTGKNADSSYKKQLYWAIFGEIAYHTIENNLASGTTCDKCKMQVPMWGTKHNCPKTTSGFYECIDCGKWCVRSNSRQYRCEECQTQYMRFKKTSQMQRYRLGKKVS